MYAIFSRRVILMLIKKHMLTSCCWLTFLFSYIINWVTYLLNYICVEVYTLLSGVLTELYRCELFVY